MDMKNRQVRSIGRPRKNFSHNRKNRTKFEEAVLNNRVLRIHLYRENLDRLRSKKPTSQRALLGKRHSTSVYATPVQSSKSPSAIHSFKTGFIRKRNSSGADQSPSSTKTRRKDFENNNLKTETTLPKPQIINKSQSKNKAVGKSTEKQKTLNKTINKNKFKIRLFPKSVGKATPMKRVVNNGKVQNSVNISDDVFDE
ncbi:hypothetical protein JTB14_023800 [Gonioctena quinquepunctata]|nr:hypothetical protein JTB14_023800 [Gonioctena quinquepunctata]